MPRINKAASDALGLKLGKTGGEGVRELPREGFQQDTSLNSGGCLCRHTLIRAFLCHSVRFWMPWGVAAVDRAGVWCVSRLLSSQKPRPTCASARK